MVLAVLMIRPILFGWKSLKHSPETSESSPLLIDRTEMFSGNSLPEDLKRLAFRNALRVDSDADFHHHINRLCSSLQSTPGSSTPTVSGFRQSVQRKNRTAFPKRVESGGK